jgi:acetylornithine deacetylase/succinyl-diaminopimelate desuccinylase-like protein
MPDQSTTLHIDPVLQSIDAGLQSSCSALFELLRFAGVGADPAHNADCRATAGWVKSYLGAMGLAVELRETTGQPVVIARLPGPGPQVLFYGHYDVQPVDPVNLWDSPPFEPRMGKNARGQDCIFGRGAADDKGQFMTFLEATRHWLAQHGSLPFGLTILIEGDEEGDASHLDRFLAANAKEFPVDFAVICDTDMYDETTPAITTSLRGCISEEISIQGPRIDLHSGYFGGPAVNPIKVLAKVLASLHDKKGKITVPGFYEGVKPLTVAQKKQLKGLRFPEKAFLADVGLKASSGEQGHSMLDQLWSRPTAEVNGIWGGYTAVGAKTVLPAKAHAKLTFRLVEGQKPNKVRAAFRKHVRKCLPLGCKVNFLSEGGDSTGIRINEDSSWFKAAQRALKAEWGKPAALIGSGGSIPVVEFMRKHLGVESLLIGFGRKDDRVHSPNEKYDLESYHRGQRSFARLIAELSKGV